MTAVMSLTPITWPFVTAEPFSSKVPALLVELATTITLSKLFSFPDH